MAQWERICLQCERCRTRRFDPWVRKISCERSPGYPLGQGLLFAAPLLRGIFQSSERLDNTPEAHSTRPWATLHPSAGLGIRPQPFAYPAGGRDEGHRAKMLGRRGNGSRLQYSCLENLIGRGAWWAIMHGIAKSWIRLSTRMHTHTHTHTHTVLTWIMTGQAETGTLPCWVNYTSGGPGGQEGSDAIAGHLLGSVSPWESSVACRRLQTLPASTSHIRWRAKQGQSQSRFYTEKAHQGFFVS